MVDMAMDMVNEVASVLGISRGSWGLALWHNIDTIIVY